MIKYLFVGNEVCGLNRIYMDLFNENKHEHNILLIELLKANFLEDITEVFTDPDDQEFIERNPTFLTYNNKLYTIDSNKQNEMRISEIFHEIIERYNQKLQKPIKTHYKEFSEDRLPFVYLMEFEDGSEGVFFTN